MTTYAIRQRVACYVTRTTERGKELLVFDHGENDALDPSGTQIPAGGMHRFEGIVDAAVRELEEETGLSGAAFVGQVGFVELGLDDPGGPSMTTYVHLSAAPDGAVAWEHVVTGEGEDSTMVFSCRWETLPLAFELAGDQGQFLANIPT